MGKINPGEKTIQGNLEQAEYSVAAKKADKKMTGNGYSFPRSESQLNHIFGNRPGHLPNTLQNQQMILRVANNNENYIGTDKYGNNWYAQIQSDGSQIWARVNGDVINNAGKNETPRIWNGESGLNNNPKINNTWRKK